MSSPSGPFVKYMVRRETHSSRAVVSVLTALVIIVILGYVLTEGILGMLGHKPLLVSWAHVARVLVGLPSSLRPVVVVCVGVVLVLVGLFLLAKAVLPGVLGRHALRDDRAAYVVDDAVIVSAISRETRDFAGLGQGRVTTTVSRRSVVASVTPTSGIPLYKTEIQQHIDALVDDYGIVPRPHVKVTVAHSGKVPK